jgi:hypothetical protein
MTNTAELAFPLDAQTDRVSAVPSNESLEAGSAPIPSIEPRMADLLELTRSTDSSDSFDGTADTRSV